LVEPLLHFAVPFAALRAADLDTRKAAFVSVIALTPDLDVLFHVHRSPAHSAIILAVATIPLLLLTRRHRALRTLVMLGALGILMHLILDLFQYYIPILWPLSGQSFWISGGLALYTDDGMFVTSSIRLLTEPTSLDPFTSFNEPVLTSTGLGISIILLAPSFMKAFLDGRRNRQTDTKRVGR